MENFLSVDPIMPIDALRSPQLWNRYAYVGNNPMNRTDPTGKILQFCGTDEDMRKVESIANEGLHGYRMKIDRRNRIAGEDESFTAGVEGFLTLAELKFDRESQVALIWLCSGYVYRLSLEAIRDADGVASAERVVDMECLFGGGAIRIAYSNGVTTDWPCDRVLRVCEPRYFAFDYERGGHELTARSNIATRHARLVPLR